MKEAAQRLRKERERQPCDVAVRESGQAAPRRRAWPGGSADATKGPQVRAPRAVLLAPCVTTESFVLIAVHIDQVTMFL